MYLGKPMPYTRPLISAAMPKQGRRGILPQSRNHRKVVSSL